MVSKTKSPFADPRSLLKAVAASPMLWSASYLKDKDKFISEAIGKWYNMMGNTLSVEPESHEDIAEELFELYTKMHEFVQTHNLSKKIYSEVFKSLIKGEIDLAYKAYGECKQKTMLSLKKPALC